MAPTPQSLEKVVVTLRRDVARQSQPTATPSGPIERFDRGHACEELANQVVALRTTEGLRLAVHPALLITAERDGYFRFASRLLGLGSNLGQLGCLGEPGVTGWVDKSSVLHARIFPKWSIFPVSADS